MHGEGQEKLPRFNSRSLERVIDLEDILERGESGDQNYRRSAALRFHRNFPPTHVNKSRIWAAKNAETKTKFIHLPYHKMKPGGNFFALQIMGQEASPKKANPLLSWLNVGGLWALIPSRGSGCFFSGRGRCSVSPLWSVVGSGVDGFVMKGHAW